MFLEGPTLITLTPAPPYPYLNAPPPPLLTSLTSYLRLPFSLFCPNIPCVNPPCLQPLSLLPLLLSPLLSFRPILGPHYLVPIPLIGPLPCLNPPHLSLRTQVLGVRTRTFRVLPCPAPTFPTLSPAQTVCSPPRTTPAPPRRARGGGRDSGHCRGPGGRERRRKGGSPRRPGRPGPDLGPLGLRRRARAPAPLAAPPGRPTGRRPRRWYLKAVLLKAFDRPAREPFDVATRTAPRALFSPS